MALFGYFSVLLLPICLFATFSSAADPFAFFDFEVSYITASPLGVPQQVCFPWILLPSAIFFLKLCCFFFPVLGALFRCMADGLVLDFESVWIFCCRSSWYADMFCRNRVHCSNWAESNWRKTISYWLLWFLPWVLQVIAINGKFPGPTINVTTNNNVVINVRNKLDENLLMHWLVLFDF